MKESQDTSKQCQTTNNSEIFYGLEILLAAGHEVSIRLPAVKNGLEASACGLLSPKMFAGLHQVEDRAQILTHGPPLLYFKTDKFICLFQSREAMCSRFRRIMISDRNEEGNGVMENYQTLNRRHKSLSNRFIYLI